MSLDRVLDALGYDGPRQGPHFACRCPAHDDDKPSLAVSVGKDGRVLLHCHAGCKSEAVLAAAGLTWRDVAPAHVAHNGNGSGHTKRVRSARPARPQPGAIVATYDYCAADGALLYQVVRLEPKQFLQRRPDGKGGWLWKVAGVPRVPYRLPELLAAPPAAWVFVVEGEKDVEALRGVGLVATCNAQGAGKWDAAYSEWLAGRRVCILPDNDDAGRAHAHQVAGRTLPQAARVRLLALPGLAAKGDVSDWLAAGHTCAELLALVEATPDLRADDLAALSIAQRPAQLAGGAGGADLLALDVVEPPAGSRDPAALDDDDPLLAYPAHDHGNARCVLHLYPKRFAFCPALGWLEHTGTHWEGETAEFALNNAITATLVRRRLAAVRAQREDLVRATVANEARKNAVKGMVRDLVVLRIADFDTDPNLLNCANGVLDLRRGELVTGEASAQFTYCVQTPFDPQAQAPLWLKFLSSSVDKYAELADWLQMAVGYSLTGLTREECMFYVEGPARSGKGTTMQTLLTLLGQPLGRGVDFATFTRPREGDSQNFDLAVLRPARLVSASESGRYASLNEAVVKSITGNDPIAAAFKHRDMFSFTPMFKVWLSSNHPARGDVDDDAFWGRIRVIRFPNSHLGHEDKQLKERMVQPDQLAGILAWAVAGAARWYQTPGGLVTPAAVVNATAAHREQLDHVKQWLDECTRRVKEHVASNTALYGSYRAWCEENGYAPKQAVAFGRALVAKGFAQAWKRDGGRSVRGYRGLLVPEEG